MDPELERSIRAETARLGQEIEQLTEAQHAVCVIARRGDDEFLVRSSAGCDYVSLSRPVVYRVHEVRALTTGGWEPVGAYGMAEVEAAQAVTRTLRPYTAARRR